MPEPVPQWYKTTWYDMIWHKRLTCPQKLMEASLVYCMEPENNWVNPGKPVLEGTFRHFLDFWCKMKITQSDAPKIWMDCHPIQTNWCPHLCYPTIFTPDHLPDTTLPIYPGLGQAPNMLACIPVALPLITRNLMKPESATYKRGNGSW